MTYLQTGPCPPSPGFHQILDVASASGEPAASLAAALPFATVHATDLSAKFVQLGAARAKRMGLRNMCCQVADAEQLEQFGDGSCDAVCCCMGLMCAFVRRGGMN